MTSKNISKADLSFNWREPLPASTTQKIAAQQTRPYAKKQTYVAPMFRTSAFAKKIMPMTMPINPYPQGPWYDLDEYKAGLKCELCKTTIRKDCIPQVLHECGHIYCAKCIHQHYTLEHKLKCDTCGIHINIQDNRDYCRVCCDAPCSCRDDCHDNDDNTCPGCGSSYCNGHCDDEPDCPHCGSGCDGSCGTLSCGCIDVCRGRCDRDEYCGGW